ncbi:MAG: hypothetical protein RLY21_2072 [Planctomycetota bacterium]|jgi:hypothetical protein
MDARDCAVPSDSIGNDGMTLEDGLAVDGTSIVGAEGVPPASERATESGDCADVGSEGRDAQPERPAQSTRTAPVAEAESVAAIRCIVTNLA